MAKSVSDRFDELLNGIRTETERIKFDILDEIYGDNGILSALKPPVMIQDQQGDEPGENDSEQDETQARGRVQPDNAFLDDPDLKRRFKLLLVRKTLAASLAVLRGESNGPAIVVVPWSYADPWIQAIRLHMNVSHTDVLHLTSGNVPPFDLHRYKVIVASYTYVSSEYKRLAKFKKEMEEYKADKPMRFPKPPKVTLLSGVWLFHDVDVSLLCADGHDPEVLENLFREKQ